MLSPELGIRILSHYLQEGVSGLIRQAEEKIGREISIQSHAKKAAQKKGTTSVRLSQRVRFPRVCIRVRRRGGRAPFPAVNRHEDGRVAGK